ncbi:MAG: hypothetical protein ACTSPY_12070 [Candidatus Helarchaeota archaeon]
MSDEDTILLKEFQKLLKNFNNSQKSLQRITEIIEKQIGIKKEKPKGLAFGISEIMDLPDELRKTALAVVRLRNKANIDNISKRTGRDKALEKGFAEALVAMGVLARKEVNNTIVYNPNLGKRKPIISDNIWTLLIKDSVEMINFICNMEIEKAELKILDIDEMMQMAPQLSEVFNEIKDSILNYIAGLKKILSIYSKGE